MKKELNIILIDDNDIDIVVNTKLLTLANLTNNISSFKSCAKVLEYIKANEESLKEYQNVILLDIQMPVVNGFECLKRLSEHADDFTNSTLVFMLSSSIDRGDIEKAEANTKVIKVLEKPLDVYLLKRLIESEIN
ncbi:MAG: response regulator [Flavobacteriales bacterium]